MVKVKSKKELKWCLKQHSENKITIKNGGLFIFVSF